MRLLSLGRKAPRRLSQGMTLIEILVVLTIFSILAMMAAPSFGEFIANSRLRESGNAVMSQVLLARSEAIKRNTRVRLTASNRTVTIVDIRVPDSPVDVASLTLTDSVTMGTTATTITFNGQGRSIDASSGNMASADINFSISTSTCSGDIRCPGLRVDGGGGVRLCGNKLSCT